MIYKLTDLEPLNSVRPYFELFDQTKALPSHHFVRRIFDKT